MNKPLINIKANQKWYIFAALYELYATLTNSLPCMKILILGLSLLLVNLVTISQTIIRSDTVIKKTVRVNESFELQFLDSPGSGYCWYLEKCDSLNIVISLLRSDLLEGDGPKGGRYISTYEYTGQCIGNYLLEYTYGRPWLKEKLYRCSLEIDIK